jgi:hypothetical protein
MRKKVTQTELEEKSENVEKTNEMITEIPSQETLVEEVSDIEIVEVEDVGLKNTNFLDSNDQVIMIKAKKKKKKKMKEKEKLKAKKAKTKR